MSTKFTACLIHGTCLRKYQCKTLMMTSILTNKDTSLKVSSVLNRDIKNYGPRHMVDGEEDTCWNSDQGSPQWIEVNLDSLSNVEEIQIQFQGGFAGKDCSLQMTDENNDKHTIMEFFPEDVNSLQISFL